MVYFYLSEKYWFDGIEQLEDWKTWEGYKDGSYCWTLQTYYYLKNIGLSCKLVNYIPNKGIIVSHKANFPSILIPNKHQLFVCCAADWGLHLFSQVNLVQNPEGEKKSGTPFIERNVTKSINIFIRLWPQSGLLKRTDSRGTQFSRLVFMGRKENLHTDLQSEHWLSFINENELEWCVVDEPADWKDYRHVDATISIRDFDDNAYDWKPATKLYNSWLAGVIPICGNESAYSFESDSKEDCLIVRTYDELCQTILHLKEDKEFRERCYKASRARSKDITFDKITDDWVNLFENRLKLELENWSNRSVLGRYFIHLRKMCGFILKKTLQK